ncbi:MAG: GspE/PulE family protein [Acidimicrobiales bacterium]
MAIVDPPLGVDRAALLGDVLSANGDVTSEVIEAALLEKNGVRIGEHLVAKGLATEDAVAWALANQHGLPFVDLTLEAPEAGALALITPATAHDLQIVPIRIHPNGTLDVVVGDPRDPRLSPVLERLPVTRVRVGMAPPSQMRAVLSQHYSAWSDVQKLATAAGIDDVVDVRDAAADLAGDDAPVIQIVNQLVSQALRDRASDVHIEPNADRVRVRFRIDGSLKEVVSLPANLARPLVSRIKIMADMNIVERRRPQDGQFAMDVDGRGLDVRVSTTATIWGEKAVLRLLDRSRSLYSFADLGMPPGPGDIYSRIVRSPFGMVIVSGPTGSGKTTTLYATLSEINRPDINIMTIEDPVEYVFPSVNQIQISEQAGLSFATGLKSILRQDPDVILVGEVRDVETARIAVQSALTGHLVLSSVHAIDSVSALYRLLDMGIESFLITSAIVGVVAQRLVRRICRACAERYEPSLQDLAVYRKLGGVEKDEWFRGRGCNLCLDTGFYDRVGVYEVLGITDEIRQCVVNGQPPRVARDLAIQNGLSTLQHEAIRLVEQDITTIGEVIKNVFVSEDFS